MSQRGRKINAVLALLMLAFIWGHSMIPAETSTAESEFALGFVQPIVEKVAMFMQSGRPYAFLTGLADKVDNNELHTFLYRCADFLQANYFCQDAGFWIRKMAHFGEYMVFGLLMCLLFSRPNGHGRFWWPMFMCLCVASIDECIQLITPGREGKVRDVALDMMGSCVGVVCTMVLLALIYGSKKRKTGKNVQ